MSEKPRGEALTKTVQIDITEKYYEDMKAISRAKDMLFSVVCRSCLYDGIDVNYDEAVLKAVREEEAHEKLRETMPKGMVKGDEFPDYDALTDKGA